MFMSIALLLVPMLIEYEYGGFMGGIFGTWGDECTRTAAGRVCTPTVALPLMNTFATTAGDTAGTGAERAARFNAFSPGMNCEVHNKTPPLASLCRPPFCVCSPGHLRS